MPWFGVEGAKWLKKVTEMEKAMVVKVKKESERKRTKMESTRVCVRVGDFLRENTAQN